MYVASENSIDTVVRIGTCRKSWVVVVVSCAEIRTVVEIFKLVQLGSTRGRWKRVFKTNAVLLDYACIYVAYTHRYVPVCANFPAPQLHIIIVVIFSFCTTGSTAVKFLTKLAPTTSNTTVKMGGTKRMSMEEKRKVILGNMTRTPK